ncbi:MFS transporter [Priestia koreensis]|uniref:MFS transporter n=1 Tax=Priestia koreensis TaxID=284581 RepID=A0A0M0KQJ5_9BACI|nr:MFS transporter [Priestia koreensis]KOO41079.1 MFS transporter [Priestia koreensis]
MLHIKFRFWILVTIVSISGFSQGMLLPIISVILEQDGVSSALNGLNATGLYIGVLLASPFMERPLQRYGYKPLIVVGGLLVILSLFSFITWKAFWFWFALRLLIGIGDHMLHFGTQTWITAFSTQKDRGRNISIYGLFFGIGFAVGPSASFLLKINPSLPFIVSSGISLLAWLTVFLLKNERPQGAVEAEAFVESFKRFGKTFKYAWVAFLPPLGYGFLEATLNGSFPVYALRNGYEVNQISILLPAFAFGSIIFQLPLGILSDKYGRHSILLAVLSTGFLAFLTASFVEGSFIALTICLFIAGMLLGSTFSLGITYMADLVPTSLLPAGNLMCGMAFSLGSISGPYLGGVFIQHFKGTSFFYFISMMILFLLIGFIFHKQPKVATVKSKHS